MVAGTTRFLLMGAVVILWTACSTAQAQCARGGQRSRMPPVMTASPFPMTTQVAAENPYASRQMQDYQRRMYAMRQQIMTQQQQLYAMRQRQMYEASQQLSEQEQASKASRLARAEANRAKRAERNKRLREQRIAEQQEKLTVASYRSVASTTE